MDLISWIYLNDPIGEKKVAIIKTGVVFICGGLSAWYIIFRVLFNRLGSIKAQDIAKSRGFDSYSDLMYIMTRNIVACTMLFFLFIMLIYGLMNEVEVKQAFKCQLLGALDEQCQRANGTMVCQRLNVVNPFSNNSFILRDSYGIDGYNKTRNYS